MLSFKALLKALLPPGSLWRPLEQYVQLNPEPDLQDPDMENGLGPQLVVDWNMENGNGPQVLVDPDMEASGTSAYTANASAILTKESTNPHSGTQCLRVSYGGSINPNAGQTVLSANKTYDITGWARGDGTFAPRVYIDSGVLAWSGTASAEWQFIKATDVPISSGFYLFAMATGSGYCEFDDFAVVETAPAWASNNSGLITKVAGDPSGSGSRVLNIAYNGVNFPFTNQAVMTADRTYQVTGWARGDGTYIPRLFNLGYGTVLWEGTSGSTDWEFFSVVFVAASATIQLYSNISGTGFVRYDNLSIKEIAPAWIPGNDAELEKDTTLPYEGDQSLKLLYNGTTQPYASQVVLNVSQEYRIRGAARSDGANKPQIYNGSFIASNLVWEGDATVDTWQEFDITWTATNTDIRFTCPASSAGEFVNFDGIVLQAIQPDPKGYFNATIEGMADTHEGIYEFLKSLAWIRNPYKTPWLSDLEKEYAIITDPNADEDTRRNELASLAYSPRGSGSLTDLQNTLNTAGLNVIVKGNSPPVDPNLGTLGAHELIANGSPMDSWAQFLGGLTNEPRWQKLFWIVSAASGWPYEYGGTIHALKNSGDMALYSDYFTHLETKDYSKFRNGAVTSTNIIKVENDGIQFDNASPVNRLNDGNMELGLGPQVLTDGDMEKTGVGAWTVGGSASLSKVAGSPSCVGSQVLQVAYGGVASPYASQICMVTARTYRVTGYARGDGTFAPFVRHGTTVEWNGTSSTTWQSFDVTFVTTSTVLRFYSNATAAGNCEFDDILVQETCPAWTASSSVMLTKELGTSPGSISGSVLRITKQSASTGWATQTLIPTGFVRVTGWARSDGVIQARFGLGVAAWTGSASGAWEYFDVDVDSSVSVFGLVAIGGGLGNWVEFNDVDFRYLNAQNSVITVPNESRFDDWEAFTLVVLADFETHLSGERFFSKRSASAIDFDLYLETSPDRIILEDNVAANSIAHNVVGDRVIAVTGSDGQASECFVDGASIGNFSGTFTANSLAEAILIGNDRDGANAFQSTMQGALVFDRVLTAQELSDLYDELIVLTTPTVTPATLTDSQKETAKKLTVKFKPISSWGLLAVETDDNLFTYTDTANYPGDPDKGYSSTTEMDGGRYIKPEDY